MRSVLSLPQSQAASHRSRHQKAGRSVAEDSSPCRLSRSFGREDYPGPAVASGISESSPTLWTSLNSSWPFTRSRCSRAFSIYKYIHMCTYMYIVSILGYEAIPHQSTRSRCSRFSCKNSKSERLRCQHPEVWMCFQTKPRRLKQDKALPALLHPSSALCSSSKDITGWICPKPSGSFVLTGSNYRCCRELQPSKRRRTAI